MMSEKTFGPMLLCLDLEAGSEHLARYTASLAHHCNQAVEVVYASQASRTPDSQLAIESRLQQLISTVLAGLDVRHIHIRPGKPETVIPELAIERNVETIVLGRRHRAVVDRIHVGSTTSAVVSQAVCPVLVVPADGTGTEK